MLNKIVIGLIRTYQYCISPMLGPHCRFSPTCSQYAQEALQEHGTVKGLGLTVKRVCKCHPFHEGGLDPVPTKNEERS